MQCKALSAQSAHGITSLVIIHAHELFNSVSPSIQAVYSSEMASESAASNSFLILNALKKMQDYKQMKPPGAVSWVSDHFSCVRFQV